MAWLYLLLAGLLEVVWAYGLKLSNNFTNLWPSIWTIAAMIGSFYLLALALKNIPLGTAYPVWTGIGAVGAVLVGILFLSEPPTLARLACIGLIISGVVGLRMLES